MLSATLRVLTALKIIMLQADGQPADARFIQVEFGNFTLCLRKLKVSSMQQRVPSRARTALVQVVLLLAG